MDPRTSPISLSPEQLARLQRFDVAQSVDIHCHVLPGVDDGPPTPADSIELCRALVRDGITTVIATPHQLGRYEGQNSAAEIRTWVTKLQADLIELEIPLTVLPGGDVRVDHRLNAMLAADEICTLGDAGRYLLLELPHETYIELRNLIADFTRQGRTIVVSHPERNGVLSRRPEAVAPWLERGAVLQVTAGSLLGDFGTLATASAWHWLEQGQIHLVASDAHHAKYRPPTMTEAINLIAQRFGEAVAKRLCADNPLRVLRGEALV
jgi:protein-tyrosine phosphatase